MIIVSFLILVFRSIKCYYVKVIRDKINMMWHYCLMTHAFYKTKK